MNQIVDDYRLLGLDKNNNEVSIVQTHTGTAIKYITIDKRLIYLYVKELDFDITTMAQAMARIENYKSKPYSIDY